MRIEVDPFLDLAVKGRLWYPWLIFSRGRAYTTRRYQQVHPTPCANCGQELDPEKNLGDPPPSQGLGPPLEMTVDSRGLLLVTS